MNDVPAQFAPIAAYLVLFVGILMVVVRLAFAWAILEDARKLALDRKRTVFVNGVIWCFAILATGVIGVFVYWMLHHSHLCKEPPPLEESAAEEGFDLDQFRER